ncbi:YciI family protein [Paenibacillaceae bacterium WGS1546]|uniref:YciI family protein n=1 Tax=Cohnella sp. WGS1546 TaxID=3366810 RepID=UPI00372CF76B
MKFVIHFRPGAAWVNGKSVFEQSLDDHGEYMQKLFDEKKLMIGGPYLDDRGGMAVIEATDKDEAAAILNNAPAIVRRIFEAEMYPLMAVFDWTTGASLQRRSE